MEGFVIEYRMVSSDEVRQTFTMAGSPREALERFCRIKEGRITVLSIQGYDRVTENYVGEKITDLSSI